MKGILNVLYRRILYKIPLKFLLVLLAICAILFASFSNAGFDYLDRTTYNFSADNIYYEFNVNNGIVCLMPNINSYNSSIVKISYIDGGFDNNINLLNKNLYAYNLMCFNQSFGIQYLGTSYNSYSFIFLSGFNNTIVSCDYSGYLTEGECNNLYSGYILESSIDSNYCENNNLCLSGGNSSGDVSWSALYINNIQHIGGSNIYIDIPEEFNWDYQYEDEDMYIDIDGYNVDYDKITGIISTQNYKPTNEDFNYIVSSVIPLFVPGLVIILFLYWIFRFIKKIF